MPRNYDPALHPLEAPREYTRALNAVKLERVFALPFIGSLDGHRDGLTCLGKHPDHLSRLYSGACDGEVLSLKKKKHFSFKPFVCIAKIVGCYEKENSAYRAGS